MPFGIKLFTVLALILPSLLFAEKSSIKDSEISLPDYFTIEGVYDIKAHYIFQNSEGAEENRLFKAMDRFVLFFDGRTRSLSGALSSSALGSPFALFENLSSRYSKDKNSILIAGTGIGSMLGNVILELNIATGVLKGRFHDSSAAGYKELTGKQTMSLKSFARKVKVPVENVDLLTGVYSGDHPRRKNCGPDKNEVCQMKFLIRAFEAETLTATLFFELGEGGGFHFTNYLGGVYVPTYGLLEFASNSKLDRRLVGKLSVRIENGIAEVFVYGTNGRFQHYVLKYSSDVLD